MKWSDKGKKYGTRFAAWMMFLLCIALVSGCTRRHVVKYGGPPDSYKTMRTDTIADKEHNAKN